jgi:hypothetical protein
VTIVTVAQAGALAAKAALRLGVPVSLWTDADPDTQQAAVDVATADLLSVPGLQIYGCESESDVQLACVVQALHRLDLMGDGNAQERRRLQDQGVSEVQQGRTRETYGRAAPALCGAARDLLRAYRGAVNCS